MARAPKLEENQENETGLPWPSETPDLFGHEDAERVVVEAWTSGRMPHAWLITGPSGIGKATFAYRIAKFVLSGGGPTDDAGLFGAAEPAAASGLAVDPESRAARLVASNGHPDLRILRRTPNDRGVLSSVIRIEDVRAFIDRVRLKPSLEGWRVAIVDEAEMMNRSSENALLKVLEEPPSNTLILIVSNSLNAMLPTTRSRCRRVALSPLKDGVVRDLLTRSERVSDQGDIEILVRLAEGSIGRALDLAAAGGAGLYRDVGSLLSRMPQLDVEELHALSGKLARRPKEGEADGFVTATSLILRWIDRSIRGASGIEDVEEGAGSAEWARRIGIEEAFRRRAGFERMIRLESALNLDRKQVLLDGLNGLATGIGLDPSVAAE
ncbi:MAG: DNA polymerase III subunit delta' [Alphaproteobacteria bacterium]|nr:DNA polymerase III subunit delta' [Alphaproteobacteria bacterium]